MGGKTKRDGFEKLIVSGCEFNAVFFHKPEEPDGFLSNWYMSDFELDGIRFSSAEQYIMYMKSMAFGDDMSGRKILATDDPAQQQAIGRGVQNYVEYIWHGMRQMVLYKGLMAKFSQNDGLKEQLLATEDAYLVECARSDRIWACGVGLYDSEKTDSSNWRGSNILGFTLMQVREQLREERTE